MANQLLPEERFWAKVNKDAPIPTHRSDLGPCWLWTASTNTGYGVFRNGQRKIYAHRFAYELLVGPIPEGLQLDHLCRMRHCVRPDHLEPVTCRENLLRGPRHLNSLKPQRQRAPAVPKAPSPYGNPRHDRVTGRFVNRRVQSLQQLADRPDREWELDDEAMVILEGGIARAVQGGWTPPAVAVPASNPDWDEAHVQPVGDAGPDRDSDRDPWLDALRSEATS